VPGPRYIHFKDAPAARSNRWKHATCKQTRDVALLLLVTILLSRGSRTLIRSQGPLNLSKDDLIDMQGTVVAVHSGGLYRVQCDAGHEVLAQLSGRMRRFRIKVVPGDRVTVGVSPYDPVRGIITFRAR
jgi:translation initiation factor IF-1